MDTLDQIIKRIDQFQWDTHDMSSRSREGLNSYSKRDTVIWKNKITEWCEERSRRTYAK